MASSRKYINMTEGSIPRLLLKFAIPMLIGNLIQQLYNTVDTVVVGKCVSKQALAAIGCTSPVINTLIGTFNGLGSGAGVVLAQYFGAGDREKLHKSSHTLVKFAVVMCFVMTFLGIFITPILLRLMGTPEDVFPDAERYLRIYFWGVSGLLLYNTGTEILRAVGDSRRPLYILTLCAVTNVVLDVYLVKYVGIGIAGAAYATVAAQVISAAAVFWLLMKKDSPCRIFLKDLRIDFPMLKLICSIGIPTAIQRAITQFSNVFVQKYINAFGSSVMAGWTAYSKLDAFAMQALSALSQAMSTFTGQNIGARKDDRVKKGIRNGFMIGYGAAVIILVPLMLFAKPMVSLFNSDPEVLAYGARFIRTVSPFYVFVVIYDVLVGTLRGAGDTKAAMIIFLSTLVVGRQIYLFVVSKVFGSLLPVSLGYAMGWLMCAIVVTVYYKTGRWKEKRIAWKAD